MKRLGLLLLIGALCFTTVNALGAVADKDIRRDPAPIATEVDVVTIAFATHTTVATSTVYVCGQLVQVSVDVPDMAGAGTITVAFENEDGDTLDSQAAIAENTNTVYRPSVAAYLTRATTIRVTATAAQSADQDITVKMYLK